MPDNRSKALQGWKRKTNPANPFSRSRSRSERPCNLQHRHCSAILAATKEHQHQSTWITPPGDATVSRTSTTHQDEIPGNIHKHRRTDSCVRGTPLSWWRHHRKGLAWPRVKTGNHTDVCGKDPSIQRPDPGRLAPFHQSSGQIPSWGNTSNAALRWQQLRNQLPIRTCSNWSTFGLHRPRSLGQEFLFDCWRTKGEHRSRTVHSLHPGAGKPDWAHCHRQSDWHLHGPKNGRRHHTTWSVHGDLVGQSHVPRSKP